MSKKGRRKAMDVTNPFEELKNQVSVSEVVERYTDSSPQASMRCVFSDHDDTNPSFSIYEVDGVSRFKCHGCGRAGSCIDLVMRLRDLGPLPAAQLIAKDFSLPFNDWIKKQSKEDSEIAQQGILIRQAFGVAADYYVDQLRKKHRRLLGSQYGFSEETINEHRIGFAPSDGRSLIEYFEEKNPDLLEAAQHSGLLVPTRKGWNDYFCGRIMFPYVVNGEVVYFIGRKTKETPDEPWEKAKYRKLQVHHPEKRDYISRAVTNSFLYGVDSVRRNDPVVVAEGITDCIAAHQAGFACVSPGAVNLASTDKKQLKRIAKRACSIVFIYDNEESCIGSKAALKWAEELSCEVDTDVYVGELPRHDGIMKIDIASFTTQGGDLGNVIDGAPPVLELMIDGLESISKQKRKPYLEKIYRTLGAMGKSERGCFEKYLQKALGGKDVIPIKSIRDSVRAQATRDKERDLADADLADQIRSIRESERGFAEIEEAVFRVTRQQLQALGCFYRTPASNELYYFVDSEKHLIPMDTTEFDYFLANRTGLPPAGSSTFTQVRGSLLAWAAENADVREVYKLAHFDKELWVLYVDTFGGTVYRTDGSEITAQDNGTEVLFTSEPEWEKWDYVENVTQEDVAAFERLFLTANYQGASEDDDDRSEIILLSWILAQFFRELHATNRT